MIGILASVDEQMCSLEVAMRPTQVNVVAAFKAVYLQGISKAWAFFGQVIDTRLRFLTCSVTLSEESTEESMEILD